MSGSGGGGDYSRPDPIVPPPKGGGGEGGGGNDPQDPCNISEVLLINSPNATVISTLRQGELLAVEYTAGPPAQLLAKKSANAVAGSITAASMMQVIQCITKNNVNYVAEVLSIKGAMCQVRLRRA